MEETEGSFRITRKVHFRLKINSLQCKISRAMRYHYGSERSGRKGHLAMMKEKRLCYRSVPVLVMTIVISYCLCPSKEQVTV